MLSSRYATVVAFALALAGCNNLFGLEASVADSDRDGIADSVDNCPFGENSQQRDSDGNGLGDVCDCVERGVDEDHDGIDDACDDCIGNAIGEDLGGNGIDDGCEQCAGATGQDEDADGVDDGCDPCTKGSSHDEDGDGIADGCDLCPTQRDDGASTTTAGILGAACDRGVFTRQRFDPLVAQDFTLWPGIVEGWTWGNDALSVDRGTRRFVRELLGPRFFVETSGTATNTVSLVCQNSFESVTCTLDVEQQMLIVTLETVPAPGALPDREGMDSVPSSVSTFRLQLRRDDGQQMHCDLLDAQGQVAQSVVVERSECLRIAVESSGTAVLDYLWIVSDRPDGA